VLIRALQRNRTNRICTYLSNYRRKRIQLYLGRDEIISLLKMWEPGRLRVEGAYEPIKREN
jgi:hypothetical protein